MTPLEIGKGFAIVQPLFLLLLLALPLLAWLRGKKGGAAAVIYSSTSLLKTLGHTRKSRAGAFLAALTYLGLASLIVALARPQWGTSRTETQASGIDIMLDIDVSGSMLSEDFTIGLKRANRLEVVKQVVSKFIDGRPNDRIGIVAFSGRPYLVSPPTLDHDWLLNNMDRIRIGVVEDGTAIGSAIAFTAGRFKNVNSRSRLIVLLTDGDDNAGRVSPMTAAEAAGVLGIKIYTIGAGTNGMVPFPIRDAFGNTFYRQVLMKFEEEGLKKIAQIAHGAYFRADTTESMKDVFAKIDKLEKTTIETKQYRNYRDLFPWFLTAGFALLMIPFLLDQTVRRRFP